MELKWNKFVRDDNSTYPKENGYYLVFCICPSASGRWYSNKKYVYYKKYLSVDPSESLIGTFDSGVNPVGSIILYWAEVPDPEEFKNDFPF